MTCMYEDATMPFLYKLTKTILTLKAGVTVQPLIPAFRGPRQKLAWATE